MREECWCDEKPLDSEKTGGGGSKISSYFVINEPNFLFFSFLPLPSSHVLYGAILRGCVRKGWKQGKKAVISSIEDCGRQNVILCTTRILPFVPRIKVLKKDR